MLFVVNIDFLNDILNKIFSRFTLILFIEKIAFDSHSHMHHHIHSNNDEAIASGENQKKNGKINSDLFNLLILKVHKKFL